VLRRYKKDIQFIHWVVCAISVCLLLFDSRAYVLELFTHFRYQYLALLFISTLFVYPRRRIGVAFGILSIALHAAAIAPHLGAPLSRAAGEATEIRFALMNVYSKNRRPEVVIEYLSKLQPDIVMLQELTPEWAQRVQRLSSIYPHQALVPRTDDFGIGILSKLPLKDTKLLQLVPNGPPSLRTIAASSNHQIQILTTHPVPPASLKRFRMRNEQLEALAREASERSGPLVVAGDMNVTVFSPYYQSLLSATGLQDVRRYLGQTPSWPTFIPPLWIAIDHAFVSPELTITDVQRGPFIYSDHWPLLFAVGAASLAANENSSS
jgi:endonuclease/exonuclease/phosphatase (EEP) superfamily protein YafD